MKLMNHCGLRKSRIHTRTACVMYMVVNIGSVRVKVIGHDVQTYFSLLYNYNNYNCDRQYTVQKCLDFFKVMIVDFIGHFREDQCF